MRSYEDRLLSRIDRGSGLSDNPEFVKKIQKSWEDLRPKMQDFSDIYPLSEIKADEKELKRLKDKFSVRSNTAILGEIVLMEGIYEEQWLSDDVEVIPASEYDDVKHGIDFVLRFENKNKKDHFVYLGVDATTSDDAIVINNKRDNIFKFLERGELGKLKYYEDPEADFKGELELPRIALVMDPEQTVEMEEIMLKKSQERSSFEKKRLKEIGMNIEKQVISQIESIIENISEKLKSPMIVKKKQAYENFLKKYQEVLAVLKK